MNASRIDIHAAAPHVYAAMAAFDAAAGEKLPLAVTELVRVRASQINGCSMCQNMHSRTALDAGEDERRLRALPAWRESTLFTDAERAALELTESMTLIAAAGVPGKVLAAARAHFDDTQLTHLLWTIAAINVWNRVGIATAAQSAPAT
jgi:AhpD family alkylhydroperoxidase